MVESIVILSMNLIVPIVLLIAGLIAKNHIPTNMYGSVGYRTKRSRSSREAWEFANKEMARIMLKLGLIMLVLSIVVSLFFIKTSVVVATIVCTVVMILQCLSLVGMIFNIEKKLKDKFGN